MNCLTQRLEFNYIIPEIRKRLISSLEEEGLKDAEISRKLRVTKSAVSQYKHKKRGKDIEFSEDIEIEIEKSAARIIHGKTADYEINKILKMLKKSKEICVLCKRYEKKIK